MITLFCHLGGTMVSGVSILDKVVETANKDINYQELQTMGIGEGNWENELLLFIKPEIFMVDDQNAIRNSVSLVFSKLDEYKAVIDGIMMVGGKVLEDFEIMNRHYGYINHLSRKASTTLTPEDKYKVFELLGLPYSEEYILLGGHEYLERYPDEDLYQLDKLWFTKKSLKLKSGFYFQAFDNGQEKIVLINGFHPVQLAHFTNHNHKILLLLLHSNTNWQVLRDDLIGSTYPERASSNSIRGTLYKNPHKYGLKTVDIGSNGVHLSAGPFEGMFEIQNFLGSILRSDPKVTPPLLLKKMLHRNIGYDEAISTSKNPVMRIDNKVIDLFGATENFNSGAAIDFWAENRSKVI